MVELAVRLVASLAVIVGLLMLVVRIGGRRFRGSGDAMVKVVHRQALGRSTAVSVVEVAGRRLVLGTTEQQVTVLADLGTEPADPPAELPAAEAPAARPLPEAPAAQPLPEAPAAAVHDDAAAQAPAPVLTREPAPEPVPEPVPAPPAAGRHRADLPAPGRHAKRPVDQPTLPVPAAPDDALPPALAVLAQAESADRPAPGRHAATPPAPDPQPVDPGSQPALPASVAQLLAMLPETGGATPGADPTPAASTDPAAVPAAEDESPTDLRRRRGRRDRTKPEGALAGSVLSPQTWRQAVGAVGRRAS